MLLLAELNLIFKVCIYKKNLFLISSFNYNKINFTLLTKIVIFHIKHIAIYIYSSGF